MKSDMALVIARTLAGEGFASTIQIEAEVEGEPIRDMATVTVTLREPTVERLHRLIEDLNERMKYGLQAQIQIASGDMKVKLT